jgi:formylglycine-generating enzyme required for sulfatase activity
VAIATTFVVASWIASCSLDLDGTASRMTDAGDDRTVIGDRVEPDVLTPDIFVPNDGGADAPVDALEAGPVVCPDAAPGPTMVNINQIYCIDSTEVTIGQYAAFLDAGPGTMQVPVFCAQNTTYFPLNWDASSGPQQANLPVVNLDWCDAYMFCQWAGKRLCGKIGGGATPYNAYADASVSQWMHACVGGDAGRAYPYGSTFDASACQTGGIDVTDAGAFPNCQGGFAGIFDMSGNAAEWEDSCVNYAGAGAGTVPCAVRGGSWGTGALAAACNAQAQGPRGTPYSYVGFRCCYP